MVNVVYILRVNKDNVDEIKSIIEEFDFKTKQEKDDLPASNIKILKVNKEFHVDDLSRALDLFQVLGGNNGVEQISPMFIPTKSKKYIIAIIASSVATFATILGAVYAIAPETSFLNMLAASGISAIVTFSSQIAYRYFRWH